MNLNNMQIPETEQKFDNGYRKIIDITDYLAFSLSFISHQWIRNKQFSMLMTKYSRQQQNLD